MVVSEQVNNQITAALTFKVPQKVGWSVRSNDQAWSGNQVSELIDCLAKNACLGATTLSLFLIFNLTDSEGPLRSAENLGPPLK